MADEITVTASITVDDGGGMTIVGNATATLDIDTAAPEKISNSMLIEYGAGSTALYLGGIPSADISYLWIKNGGPDVCDIYIDSTQIATLPVDGVMLIPPKMGTDIKARTQGSGDTALLNYVITGSTI